MPTISALAPLRAGCGIAGDMVFVPSVNGNRLVAVPLSGLGASSRLARSLPGRGAAGAGAEQLFELLEPCSAFARGHAGGLGGAPDGFEDSLSLARVGRQHVGDGCQRGLRVE